MIRTHLISEAVSRYNSGESITAIRGLLGGCLPEVRAALVENGCIIRSRGRPGVYQPARRRGASTVHDMVHMYEQDGMNLREIAEKLNTNHQNISHYMTRHGFPPSSLTLGYRPFVPDILQSAILDAYTDGLAPRDLCKTFGISKTQLHCLRTKAEIQAHPVGFLNRSPRYDELNEEVKKRYLAGDLGRDIVSDLGIQEPRIYCILRRQGISTNRPRIKGVQPKWLVGAYKGKTTKRKKDKAMTTTQLVRQDMIRRVKELRQHGFAYEIISSILKISRSSANRYAKA